MEGKKAASRAPRRKPAAVRPVPAEREQLIAQAAFYRAERRKFAPGHELQDWLEAEAEVDALLFPATRKRTPRKAPATPAKRAQSKGKVARSGKSTSS